MYQSTKIGKRLQMVRSSIGINIEEVCDEIHREKDWLMGVESGYPVTEDELIELCSFYGETIR